MKKKYQCWIALAISFVVSLSACGSAKHVHSYDEVAAVKGKCTVNGVAEHYDCVCGMHFLFTGDGYEEVSYEDLLTPPEHTLGAETAEVKADCLTDGIKAYSTCADCGKFFVRDGDGYVESNLSELTIKSKGHDFSQKKVGEKYLVSDATEDTPAIYKKSCSRCGEASDGANDTFRYGKTLSYYRSQDKTGFEPTSLTLSMYNTSENLYGFTWNVVKEPGKAAVVFSEGKVISSDAARCVADVVESSSYKYGSPDEEITYYICKAVVKLKPATTYTYRVTDLYADVSLSDVTFVTPDAESTSVRFAHVSDSQVGVTNMTTAAKTGTFFGRVLKQVVADGNDFVVHTGDVVEWSKYEDFWQNMLDENFDCLSVIPVQAISGNHETTYKNGINETYKHFSYAMPDQPTATGFYYSFSYADVKFIMLNTNRLNNNALTDDQYNWLEGQLKNKTEKWTVVAMHNPVYSAGTYGSKPGKTAVSDKLKIQLGKIFAEYGVDIVLQGHDHCVSRTYPINGNQMPTADTTEIYDGIEYSVDPQGVIYVMNGPAGNQVAGRLYAGYDARYFSYAAEAKASSWAEIEIDGNKLTVTAKYYDAGSSHTEVGHKWGIIKKV